MPVSDQQLFALADFSLQDMNAQPMLTGLLVNATLEAHVRVLAGAMKVICETSQYDKLADAFEKLEISPDSSELAYLPENLISVSEEDVARKILKLIDSLDELVLGLFQLDSECIGGTGLLIVSVKGSVQWRSSL